MASAVAPEPLTSSQGRADPAPLLLCLGPAPQGVPAGSLSSRWGQVVLREAVWGPLRRASCTWSRHAPAGCPRAPWRLPGVRLVCAPPHRAPVSSWVEPWLGTTGAGLVPRGQERAAFDALSQWVSGRGPEGAPGSGVRGLGGPRVRCRGRPPGKAVPGGGRGVAARSSKGPEGERELRMACLKGAGGWEGSGGLVGGRGLCAHEAGSPKPLGRREWVLSPREKDSARLCCTLRFIWWSGFKVSATKWKKANRT